MQQATETNQAPPRHNVAAMDPVLRPRGPRVGFLRMTNDVGADRLRSDA